MAKRPGDNAEIVQVNTAIKKTGRGGKYNFPNAIEPENPEDVREVLTECLHWYEVGNTKAQTDEEIEQRTFDFFQHCIDTGERPTVEKYALALGYPRQTLFKWEQDINSRRGDIIKKAKETLAAFDTGLVMQGKLNPIPWIFRAKNYYGMKDQQDIVLEPKQGITDQTAEDVAEKYAELPE